MTDFHAVGIEAFEERDAIARRGRPRIARVTDAIEIGIATGVDQERAAIT